MSSTHSSTAVSSHSSTPAFLLSDEYLAADLSDIDDTDTLPNLTLDQHTAAIQHSGQQYSGTDGVEEVDEDGVVKLAVDDETRAQLHEIQGVLSAQLEGKPPPSHFSTAFANRRAVHDRLTTAATPASSSSHTTAATSQSSLLSLLASKEADLQLAAQLGEALSDKTETLEQYCRHLEQQLATLHSPTTANSQHHNTTHHNGTHAAQPTSDTADSTTATHRTSHSLSSVVDGTTAEEEVARLRLELRRLERRTAVSESWHRDALKAARNERRETEERVKELERDGRRREAEEVERRKRDEEEVVRLTEEVEQLRAMEQQRLIRERELRRQREQKEKADDDEHIHRREQTIQAEHRWRDEQRRREEVERRCRTLEKQRDEAIERVTLQSKEFEVRRRRWEAERGRAVDDELERHRSQTKALAEQYRAVEEQMRQQNGKQRTLSVDTSGRLSPSPSTPPLSAEEGRERRAVLVSHSTQTPGEWMQQLDRAESAMTIPKGRSEMERVLYSPLHFTLLSPSTTATVEEGTSHKENNREEKKEVAAAVSGRDGRTEEEVDGLVIPLSLITPPRQATRSPYLSPHSPLPTAVELTDEDERALIDIVAPTIAIAANVVADSTEAAVDAAAVSKVSFLSPHYSQHPSSDTVVAVSASESAAPTVTPTTPLRRTGAISKMSAFLTSPLLTRPLFRSPQQTPPPPPPASLSSTAASSPLLFTLHTSHPSSIRAHLTASSTSSPLPPLPPLSTPFTQLQSSLVKQGSSSGGLGRLQPCTDDATKRVFSLLMQTRMGEGVAGFG